MRVAFAGASGTGKSFLTRYVSETYGWPINPVGSRSVALAMGFASPYDVDAAGKRAEFQERVFTEKREWEATHDNFVTDRTYFDNLTYTSMHGAAQTVDLEAHVVAMHRYDAIFLCRVRDFQKLGDDPARVHDPTYHIIYDCLLRGLIYDHFTGKLDERPMVRFRPKEFRKDFITTELSRLSRQ